LIVRLRLRLQLSVLYSFLIVFILSVPEYS
jgi:hypothetical protein